MTRDIFQQRKQSILSKKDKSSAKKWDKKISELCNKLNENENYYTTSSCSGRIIIIKDKDKKSSGLFEFVSHDLIEVEKLKNKIKNLKSNLKFKQEPPIFHVACRNLKDAEKILNLSREAGWKRSGIISLGKNVIVEILSTEKLEFPLITEGELLINEKFLKIVIKKANENLKKGWKKIANLKKQI